MAKDNKNTGKPEDEKISEAAENAQTDENIKENGADVSEQENKPDEKDMKIESLEKALKAEKDKYLRLAAEYDNFRKRNQKEREGLYSDVRCDTIKRMLPVYDNLSRALKQETADTAYKKGVEMTMTQLEQILEKLNVTAIPAVGEKFDPTVHNAVMHIEDDSYEDGVIIEEYEKGFMLGDKVIRFSMVVVAN